MHRSSLTVLASFLSFALIGCSDTGSGQDGNGGSMQGAGQLHLGALAGAAAEQGDRGVPMGSWSHADHGVDDTATAAAAETEDLGALGTYALYVDPVSNASRQADEWRTSAPDDAAMMDNLAAQPLALWIGDWTTDVTDTVDESLDAGGDKLRTLVVYNIPYRDCGAWSAGGAADADAYGTFIDEIAAGIDGRDVLVVLEPDALPLLHCLDASQIAERKSLMSYAVDTLTDAGARVYLDAGDSNWIGATTMAADLADAGVARAAGFSLNVSHTETTSDSIEYAEELRAILGDDAHYLVDTGRGGLGPTEDNQWCNPLGRATGEEPTLVTGVDGFDAALWIKPPGESDGECNGGPAAGKWWASYALELAELGAAI